jgi:hypothetical protein
MLCAHMCVGPKKRNMKDRLTTKPKVINKIP